MNIWTRITEGIIVIVIASVLFGGLMLFTRDAKADFMLVMEDGKTRSQFGHERFVSYYDCRDRGLKNQALLSLYTTRIGFGCNFIEGSE